MTLEYNPAFHLRCQIALCSGRRVRLASLRQWMTYGGLVEGVPWREHNDQIVDGSLQEAGRGGVEGARPFLIAPARRDYLRVPGDMAGHRAITGVPAEWLPMVTCVGVLWDAAPARDQGKDGSRLTVVWFQDEYALPIDGSVFPQLRAVNWEQLAADEEF